MSHFAEPQTEWILNNILVNGGWIIDNLPKKNVYFRKARPEHQHLLESFSKKKGYKKPDYILYKDNELIGVIEAKKGGELLDKALKQATEYADMLEAPLVFASNGSYVETYHLTKHKPLFINGEKVDRLIKYKEAIQFIALGENEIYTIPRELIKSKEDLIGVFKKVNKLLRKANIFSGYDRISEFSTILFLKLISEKEGKNYWNSIKQQNDDFLLSYLNKTVISELEEYYGGGVFSEINIKKINLLRQIMDMIDPLILSDIKTDIKGDAFEYFLKNMNQADNDLGQYFTPRHIVKAMVHLINPKFKETVYDPFCGTGGFLIEAFNHITENSIIKIEEDQKILKERTLFGRDATKVSTIAKKNMILHGDGHSNIEEIDSIENPIIKKVNVILTNIPFSLQDIELNCTNHYYNGLGKKNGDAVCVLHCLDALEEGGRMALIVPEGFLFNKGLEEVRKFLLSRANLELVVSLPQGVFLPYAGVKTDILYFTNAHKPEIREGYYYFEVKKDGFTLDAHRRKIDGVNDIHKLEATNIRKGEKELLKEQGFEFVDFEKVRVNNYNLVGSVYRKQKNENANITSFENLLSRGLIVGQKGKMITKNMVSEGNIPVIAGGARSPYFHNQYNYKGNVITISASGTAGYVWYHQKPIWASDCSVLYSTDEEVLSTKYLYYILKAQQKIIYQKKHGTSQPHIYLSDLKDLQIILLSMLQQQSIVKELDSYQKIIDGLKQAIQNWKPYFKTDNNWELVKICDICTKIYAGGDAPKHNFSAIKTDDFNIPIYSNGIEKNALYGYTNVFKINQACVTVSARGTIGYAVPRNEPFYPIVRLLVLVPKECVDYRYLAYAINSIDLKKSGSTTPQLTIPELSSHAIYLPPLDKQQEIVEQLEQERKMIDSQKEIIKLFEAKIQNKLNSIWQFEEENKINK